MNKVKEKPLRPKASVAAIPLDGIDTGQIGQIKKEKLKKYKDLILNEVAKRRK